MRYQLRDYQQVAVDFAVGFLRAAGPGEKRLLAAPTGSGKSLIIAAVQGRLGPDTVVVTPRVEIIYGFLDKMGHDLAGLGARRVVELAERTGIVTPIRLRNLLAGGQIAHPRRLLVDEVHHFTAQTYREIELLLNHVPMAGFTATPFRGTPRLTACRSVRTQCTSPQNSSSSAVPRGVPRKGVAVNPAIGTWLSRSSISR